jgi:hypothetical protein
MSILAAESSRDLLRWTFSTALVLCAHAAIAAAMTKLVRSATLRTIDVCNEVP